MARSHPLHSPARAPRGLNRSLKSLLRTSVLGSALLLTACISSPVQRQFPDRDLSDMVTVGLRHIDTQYVHQLDIGQVAIAGLTELQEHEPALVVRRGQLGLVTELANVRREYPVADPTDFEDWAKASVDAINGLRARSPRIGNLSGEDLTRSLFEGYEEQLDDFSRYLEPEEARDQGDRFLGFGGLGTTVDNEPRGVRINTVIKNAPADKAGIQRGDLIVGVNGRAFAANRPLSERLKVLKGPVGSGVTVTIDRNGRIFNTRVVRAEVVGESVKLSIENDVALLRISTFNKDTAKRVAESVFQAGNQQRVARRPLRGVILDVRDNGGGLRSAVVDLADIFLNDSQITRTRGRTDRANREFRTDSADITRGLPVVVLINESSASASELLAAAIQDNGRGVVVGSTSFGKGSVQSRLPLPNGGEFSITTARFLGPSGALLHDYGVVPTVCTSNNVTQPVVYAQQLRAGQVDLAAAQARRAMVRNPRTPVALHRSYCPPSEATPDRDTEVARLILNDRELYQTILLRFAQTSR